MQHIGDARRLRKTLSVGAPIVRRRARPDADTGDAASAVRDGDPGTGRSPDADRRGAASHRSPDGADVAMPETVPGEADLAPGAFGGGARGRRAARALARRGAAAAAAAAVAQVTGTAAMTAVPGTTAVPEGTSAALDTTAPPDTSPASVTDAGPEPGGTVARARKPAPRAAGPYGTGLPAVPWLGGAEMHGWWDWSALVERLHDDLGTVRLTDRFDVATETTANGQVHVVRPGSAASRQEPPATPSLPAAGDARAALLSRLELVHGIGPVTAAALRAGGTWTVADLVGTDRHGSGAAEVCAEWEAGDLVAVADRLQRRMAGHGHMLGALLAACVDPAEVVFLDLETLGLAGNVVFLCGTGRIVDGTFEVEQYLAPGHADEPVMLERVLRVLGEARVVVTYNGRTADLVWLRSRCFYHGLPDPPEMAHVDLVFGTRRRFVRDEPVLDDARLVTVQDQLLGIGRPAYDVPSAAVPDIYQEYVRTGCEGLLVPVLDHNGSDLLALVALLGRMCDEALHWCR